MNCKSNFTSEILTCFCRFGETEITGKLSIYKRVKIIELHRRHFNAKLAV